MPDPWRTSFSVNSPFLCGCRFCGGFCSNPQATEHEAFDAAQALDAGRPVPGGWTVHAAGDLDGDELKKWKDLIRRSTPAARDIAMVDAWKNVALVGLVSFVLAALSYLVGRALRYIFAGPSR